MTQVLSKLFLNTDSLFFCFFSCTAVPYLIVGNNTARHFNSLAPMSNGFSHHPTKMRTISHTPSVVMKSGNSTWTLPEGPKNIP